MLPLNRNPGVAIASSFNQKGSSFNVFFKVASHYIIYRNPALQYVEIKIAQENVDVSIMQVFNAAVAKVFEKKLMTGSIKFRPEN